MIKYFKSIPTFARENGLGWGGDDENGGREAGEEARDSRSVVVAAAAAAVPEQWQEVLRVEKSLNSVEILQVEPTEFAALSDTAVSGSRE